MPNSVFSGPINIKLAMCIPFFIPIISQSWLFESHTGLFCQNNNKTSSFLSSSVLLVNILSCCLPIQFDNTADPAYPVKLSLDLVS